MSEREEEEEEGNSELDENEVWKVCAPDVERLKID